MCVTYQLRAECDHMCDPGADLVPALLTVSASPLPAAADPDDDGKVAAATTHSPILSPLSPLRSAPLSHCGAVREGAAWCSPGCAATVMRPVLVTTKKIFVSDHGA